MRVAVAAGLLVLAAALPEGWKARLDDPAAKLDDVKIQLDDKNDSVTLTGVPAGIYYKPGMKADGDYELTAAFSELKPADKPVAYGFFIAGVDLDKSTWQYTSFLVRHDGRFSIQRTAGAKTRPAVAWRTALTMKEPKGIQLSNTLSIRAAGGIVRFFVDDKEVAKLTRAQVGGDGIAGIRVNPGLNLQVNKLEVKKPK